MESVAAEMHERFTGLQQRAVGYLGDEEFVIGAEIGGRDQATLEPGE